MIIENHDQSNLFYEEIEARVGRETANKKKKGETDDNSFPRKRLPLSTGGSLVEWN